MKKFVYNLFTSENGIRMSSETLEFIATQYSTKEEIVKILHLFRNNFNTATINISQIKDLDNKNIGRKKTFIIKPSKYQPIALTKKYDTLKKYIHLPLTSIAMVNTEPSVIFGIFYRDKYGKNVLEDDHGIITLDFEGCENDTFLYENVFVAIEGKIKQEYRKNDLENFTSKKNEIDNLKSNNKEYIKIDQSIDKKILIDQSIDKKILIDQSIDKKTLIDKTLVDQSIDKETSIDQSIDKEISIDQSIDKEISIDQSIDKKTLIDKTSIDQSIDKETLIDKTLIDKTLIDKTLIDKTSIDQSIDKKTLVDKTLVDKETLVDKTSIDQKTFLCKKIIYPEISSYNPENIFLEDKKIKILVFSCYTKNSEKYVNEIVTKTGPSIIVMSVHEKDAYYRKDNIDVILYPCQCISIHHPSFQNFFETSISQSQTFNKNQSVDTEKNNSIHLTTNPFTIETCNKNISFIDYDIVKYRKNGIFINKNPLESFLRCFISQRSYNPFYSSDLSYDNIPNIIVVSQKFYPFIMEIDNVKITSILPIENKCYLLIDLSTDEINIISENI